VDVALVVALFIALHSSPENVGAVLSAVQFVTGAAAGCAATGAGSMAYRDGKSGGLTSSQGEAAMAAHGILSSPDEP
tara:strand:+ start:321 stop:551 length:231 start_codon:yes stop_codon:yes gene_type:complete